MEVVFGLSAWLIFPALLLAGALSFWLYRFRSGEEVLGARLKWVLTSFRFLVLFIVLILLLEPLFKNLMIRVDKPIVLIAVDESESMVLTKDSGWVKNDLKPLITELTEELGDDYKVEVKGFDNDLNATASFTYQGGVSDFGATSNSLANSYANANLGALVWISDGIQNKGESPLYTLDQIKAPVYTVAVGDTNPLLDASIINLNTNSTAFKGNDFPVQVGIRTAKLAGKSGSVSILKDGRILVSQPFTVGASNFGREFNFTLKAEKPGIQQYVVSVSIFDGEKNLKNNLRSFYLDVIEDREKILLLYSHVHPDIGALTRSIQTVQSYELVVTDAAAFTGTLNDYSLVIFHQTGPIDLTQRRLLEGVNKLSKPLWLFLGPNSDWGYISQAGLGVKINGAQGQNQVQARINESFQLFAGDALSQAELYDFPPVSVPFAELDCSPAIVPIYFQQLDRLSTTSPLLAFSQGSVGRRGFFFGEGIWRWRMSAYQRDQSVQNFDALISRCVQYLTVSGNQKQLMVNAERAYREGTDINIGAELFNDAGQFVSGQEILFDLIYQDSVRYKYAFNKGAVGYDLNLGDLPAGKYAYSASVTYGGKKLNDAGKFAVEAAQLESTDLTANHSLLYQMASATGGKMLYRDQLKQLAELIRNNPVVKATSYSSSEVSDAIKLRWICVLLIALLGVEWYLRKRNGLY